MYGNCSQSKKSIIYQSQIGCRGRIRKGRPPANKEHLCRRNFVVSAQARLKPSPLYTCKSTNCQHRVETTKQVVEELPNILWTLLSEGVLSITCLSPSGGCFVQTAALINVELATNLLARFFVECHVLKVPDMVVLVLYGARRAGLSGYGMPRYLPHWYRDAATRKSRQHYPICRRFWRP